MRIYVRSHLTNNQKRSKDSVRELNISGYDSSLIAFYGHKKNEAQTVIWTMQSFYQTENYCKGESARREN